MGTLAQAMEAPFRLGTGTHTELSKVIGVNNKERGITRAAVASSSSSSSKQASKQAAYTKPRFYRTPILRIHVHLHTAPGNLCSLFLNVVFHVPPSTPRPERLQHDHFQALLSSERARYQPAAWVAVNSTRMARMREG